MHKREAMKHPCIILVEDDLLVGEIARDILTGDGYTVQLVQESREALAAIKAGMPKLVITDIMMPGITGLDICKAVKADPALHNIKLMVMSAKAFGVEKRRAAALGAAFFLQKPFDEKTLIKTVRSIIGDPA